MDRRGEDQGEFDVDEDKKVARSRAGKDDDEDGSYVGQTATDDAVDAAETGAEARSGPEER